MEKKKTKQGPGYITGKEQKDLVKRDFYMFQKKMVLKSDLEKLRDGFEADKKRLEKAIDKSNRK